METILKISLFVIILYFELSSVQAKTSVIKIPLYSKSISIDPNEALDQSSLWVSRQLNCQLVRQKGRLSINEAAKDTRFINPEQIEFTLDEKIKFSDGSQLTAEDVKYSFEYLKKTHSIQKNLTDWVKEIKIISKFKLIYIFKKSTPQFLRQYGSPHYPLFKKEFLAKAQNDAKLWKNPVGCGAYKLKRWDDNLHMIRLEAIGQGLPIEFYFQPLNQIDLNQAAKFDIISLPIKDGKSPEGYREERLFDPYQIFIGLNTTIPKWKNRSKRCDFFSKIKNEIVLKSYGSLAEPATDFFPRGVLGFNSEKKKLQFIASNISSENNIKKNKKTINSKSKFCLTFLTVSIPEMYRSSYIKMMEENGQQVQEKLIESPVRYATNFLESKCDAIAVGFKANYLDGYEYLVTFLKSQTNFTGYENKSIAQKIEASQTINSNDERAEAYKIIAQDILDQCVAYPLITLPEKRIFIRNNLSTPNIGEVPLNDYLLESVR